MPLNKPAFRSKLSDHCRRKGFILAYFSAFSLLVFLAFVIFRSTFERIIKIQEDEIDLLSIDLDGNDAHIFESITCINPRVVIIEYNARFIPPVKYCVKYKNVSGASIKKKRFVYGAGP